MLGELSAEQAPPLREARVAADGGLAAAETAAERTLPLPLPQTSPLTPKEEAALADAMPAETIPAQVERRPFVLLHGERVRVGVGPLRGQMGRVTSPRPGMYVSARLDDGTELTAQNAGRFEPVERQEEDWRGAPIDEARVERCDVCGGFGVEAFCEPDWSHVVLVGCGADKADKPAAAEDFYKGRDFKAAMAAAREAAAGVEILSAKYGVVDPRDVIAPYELHVSQLVPLEVAQWSRDVVRALAAESVAPVRLIVLAGADYYRPVALEAMRRGLPPPLAPLAGVTQGRRIGVIRSFGVAAPADSPKEEAALLDVMPAEAAADAAAAPEEVIRQPEVAPRCNCPSATRGLPFRAACGNARAGFRGGEPCGCQCHAETAAAEPEDAEPSDSDRPTEPPADSGAPDSGRPATEQDSHAPAAVAVAVEAELREARVARLRDRVEVRLVEAGAARAAAGDVGTGEALFGVAAALRRAAPRRTEEDERAALWSLLEGACGDATRAPLWDITRDLLSFCEAEGPRGLTCQRPRGHEGNHGGDFEEPTIGCRGCGAAPGTHCAERCPNKHAANAADPDNEPLSARDFCHGGGTYERPAETAPPEGPPLRRRCVVRLLNYSALTPFVSDPKAFRENSGAPSMGNDAQAHRWETGLQAREWCMETWGSGWSTVAVVEPEPLAAGMRYRGLTPCFSVEEWTAKLWDLVRARLAKRPAPRITEEWGGVARGLFVLMRLVDVLLGFERRPYVQTRAVRGALRGAERGDELEAAAVLRALMGRDEADPRLAGWHPWTQGDAALGLAAEREFRRAPLWAASAAAMLLEGDPKGPPTHRAVEEYKQALHVLAVGLSFEALAAQRAQGQLPSLGAAADTAAAFVVEARAIALTGRWSWSPWRNEDEDAKEAGERLGLLFASHAHEAVAELRADDGGAPRVVLRGAP